MYGPAPARPKKTGICRSRTGCSNCKQRRKKCDGLKPSCSNCVKLGKICEQVILPLKFFNVNIYSKQDGRRQNRPGKKFTTSLVPVASFGTGDVQQHYRPPVFETFPTIPTPLDRSSDTLSADSQSGSAKSLNPTDHDDAELGWSQHLDSDYDVRGSLIAQAVSSPSLRGQQSAIELAEDACVRMVPTFLPCHDYSLAITFYMDIWRDHCLPALHLSFFHIEDLCIQSQLIRDTMATLSACRLSRTLPQKSLLSAKSGPSRSFRPDAGHESLSGELYGYAMREMSRWSCAELDSQPTVALVVLVLFCYLESSMGNFREFQVHSTAVEKLLTSYSSPIMSTVGGLLAAWVEVKMQNWWRRAHFGVPGFYRDWSIPLLSPMFEKMLTVADYRRASILWILCESHRLNIARYIACHEETYSNQFDPFYMSPLSERVGDTASEHKLSENEFAALIMVQSEKLDQWHASLRDYELPEIMEIQENRSNFLIKKPEDAAIRFRSHSQAMNFAYYIAARVMQCTNLLQSPGTHPLTRADDSYEEAEAWIQILLRIAAGMNWKECVRLNVYTIGLTGLLLTCALHSRKLATGCWIQEWLEDRLKEGDPEEGNFPVFQILEALYIVNYERRNGRDVQSLFQTVDDGGGSGKFGSYCSQLIRSFLVYARCSTTGTLYSYKTSPSDLRSEPLFGL